MLESLANHITDWLFIAPIAVCFAGAFIGGTVVVIIFATFAGSADLPWLPIFVGAFLGNFASDIGWFALARSRFANWIRNSRHFAARAAELARLRDNHRKRDVLFFVGIKFAYGLRIAQNLLLGAAHYPWRRYLALNGFAVAVINGFAVAAGWSLGRGVTRTMDWFERTGTLVTAIVIVLLLFFALRWAVNRYMRRRR